MTFVVRMRLFTGLAVLVALVFATLPAVPATAAKTPSDLDTQITSALAEVNSIRKSAGKPALTLNCAISDVSQTWSAKQADSNTMKHNPNFVDQIPAGWSKAGETVAKGQSSLVYAVKAWKGSSDHYKIMVGDYTHVGFGMAISSGGTRYYTANFGKYSGSMSDYCEPVDDGSLPSRIAGVDRYQTASYIASVWDWDHDADVVFLATGENYPDALSAAAAAGKLGAPVLLTPKKSLPSEVKSRLRELDPSKVVILGSTASVSSSVESAVKSIVGSSNVVRLGGSDRYETMRRIVRFAWDDPASSGLIPAPTVIIATGGNFPDALSAGPAASVDGGAVVLVDGTASSIPAPSLTLISQLSPRQIIIAGGTGTVSTKIEKQLASLYPGMVARVAGSDRFDTSRRLVARFFTASSGVFFATGRNFPDALAGAALAGALPAPLLVTDKSCVSSATKSLVLSLGASDRVLLGSPTTLSTSVASLKTC